MEPSTLSNIISEQTPMQQNNALHNMQQVVSQWQKVMVPTQRNKRRRESNDDFRPKTRVFEPATPVAHGQMQNTATPSTLNNS